MTARGLPIELDRSVPFVAAVFDYIEGRSNLVTAVELLREAEVRVGAAIWREPEDSEFPPGVYVPRGQIELSPVEAASNWESVSSQFRFDNEEDVDRLITDRLNALLCETHLILQGIDFSDDHFLALADGTLRGWTQRSWGAKLASWANRTNWGPHFNKRGDQYSWKYFAFYVGMGNAAVRDYEKWAEAVRDVLLAKTERYVAAP